jgi:hypothetical protein
MKIFYGSAMIDDFSQHKLEAVASHHPDTYMGLEGFIYFDKIDNSSRSAKQYEFTWVTVCNVEDVLLVGSDHLLFLKVK